MMKVGTSEMTRIIQRVGKIAVLMGGAAAEREISLKSGRAIWQALDRSGFDVEPVVWDGKSLNIFDEERFQFFFIAVHGKGGEDGSIQAVLDIKGVPYTGSGILSSALGMDKRKSKIIWRHMGLRTPDFLSVGKGATVEEVEHIGFPLVVKPPCQGSSIGVSLVRSELEFRSALEEADHYGSEIMVEKYISGFEYTVPVLGKKALPVVKIETEHDFYDFSAKYDSNTTRYICPSDLTLEKEKEISALALQSYSSLGCGGWGRVDFIQDNDGEFHVIEINTVPGMTSHSLVPMSAKSAGFSFEQLVVEILRLAIEEDANK